MGAEESTGERTGDATGKGGDGPAGGGISAKTGTAGASAHPGGGAGAGGRGPRTSLVTALMLAMALVALDSSIVSTAVPQIVGDLGGFAVFSWLFAGYLLAVTVTLPVYGKLSDTFGRKPVLLFGIALFLLGSLLCALAWNMAALIAFRLVQGLGGGALQGTVQTLAADLYPLKERPKIQARMSSVWAASAVAGPALGGFIAAYADWRWIFLINLPLGGLALWMLARHLVEPVRSPGGAARSTGRARSASSPAADYCSSRWYRAGSPGPGCPCPPSACSARARPWRPWSSRSNAGPKNRSCPGGCGAGAPSPP